MEIKGKGIREYRTAFEQGRIKPNDSLYVRNRGLEHYIIKSDGNLDWGNESQREDTEKLTLTQILSRKNWYVEILRTRKI